VTVTNFDFETVTVTNFESRASLPFRFTRARRREGAPAAKPHRPSKAGMKGAARLFAPDPSRLRAFA
jgi:hypothetical protein